jgi:hypothetical protein
VYIEKKEQVMKINVDIKKHAVQSKRIAVSMTNGMYAKLKTRARQYSISISKLTNQVLDGFLKSYPEKKK